MTAEGYKTFINGSIMASFMEGIVASILEEKSGAGYGTNCSQLNTVISVIEAMYLCEGIWLFLFALRIDFYNKPSALESEIHPSHKTPFCTLCISRLHRAKRGCLQTDLARAAYF